jgi:hypothetical protein
VVTTLEKRGCIRPGLLSAGECCAGADLLGICVMRDNDEGEHAWEELRNQLGAEKELRCAHLAAHEIRRKLLLLELGELRSRGKPSGVRQG